MMPIRPRQAAGSDAFPMAATTAGDWREAAAECARRLGTGHGAELGFVYATDAWADAFPALVGALRERTGIEHWVGTVGSGICWTGHEHYEAPGLAVMAAPLPAESWRLLPPLREDMSPLAEHAGWLGQLESCLGVVHGDPHNPHMPRLIAQLAGLLPNGFLVGGLSSSRAAHPQVAGAAAEGCLAGVLLDGALGVRTALSQGCTPIGGRHVVTECERNILIGIDGRPALDVFEEEIGEVLARDLRRAAGYIFVGFPVPGSDTGDYLVRNVVGVDMRHRLLAVGDLLEPGQPLLFCRRDANTAWADLERMLDELAARLDRPPRGALYFSCLGRGRHTFGEGSRELGLIRERLGEVPLVGFFANGEIHRDRLYGWTGVLAVF